jgi:hypothetical protein
MRRWAPALAVAAVPLVVATVRALVRGWLPVGDNAYFAIRARDVLTEHHPLVGAWSSGSAAVGVDVNNLGPLQLDLLAVPVRLFGFGPGTAIGVALVNLAAVALVVILPSRRMGSLGAWLGAAVASAVTWTLGSELLFEPRQHHALVLPFLALLVTAWALATGTRWAAPVVAGLASLIAQTHFTFVVPVAVVVLVAAAMAGAARRTSGWRAPLLVTAGVLLLCWAQPIVEELGAGDGNLSAVLDAGSADTAGYGVSRAMRSTAAVLLPPDGWWRPSFRRFDPAGDLPSLGVSLVGLGVAAAVLTASYVSGRRRRDRAVTTWAALAGGAVGAAVLGAALSPVTGPLGVVSGNFRYLWPIAVFATAAPVLAVARACSPVGRRRATAALAGVAVVLALAALPTSYQSLGPETDAPMIPVARSLYDQVADEDIAGSVVVDRSGLYFGEPFTYVVVAALQDAGTDIRFATTTDVSRFGDDRAPDGHTTGTVSFALGGAALEDQPGVRLLARASLLDDDARDELAELEALASPTPEQEARREELRTRAQLGTVAVWLTPGS